MKKKKTLIISIVAVLVIAVGVLLTLLLWPKKSNKQVYSDAVKESFSFVTEKDGFAASKLAEVQDVLANKIIKLVVEDKTNNIGKLELYAGDESFYGIVNSAMEGKNLVANALFKDNKLYFKVDGVTDGYYYIDADELSSQAMNGMEIGVDGVNIDLNVQKLTEYLIESLLSSVKEKNIEKDSSSITINDKKYDTDKYAYTYTGEDLYDALKEFVKNIKDDDELYSQLSKLYEQTGETEYSFDKALDEIVNEAADLKEAGDLLTYTVYVKDGNTLSTQITSPQLPVALVVDTIEGEYYEAYVLAMGQKYVDFKATVNGDTTKFELEIAEEKVADGEFNKTKDGFAFVININGNHEMPITGKIEGDFVTSGDLGLEGTIKYNINGLETTGIDGEISVKTEEVDSMPTVDVSSAKHYEEMSDNEREALEEMGLDF